MRVIILVILQFVICLSILHAKLDTELVKKGKDYFGLFQYDKAIQHLEKAIQISPKNSEAHYYLGLSYRKLNNFEKALSHFEKALELEPSNEDYQKVVASIYVALARESKSKGNIEQMINFLTKACIAYPKEVHNWSVLFEILQSQGRYNEILSLAVTVRKHSRELIEDGESRELQNVFVIAALAAKKVNDVAKVREYANLAARFRHNNDIVLQLKKELQTTTKHVSNEIFTTGKEMYKQKKYKEALDYLQKAREIEPQNNEITELIDKIRTEITIQEFLEAAKEAEMQKKFDIALEKLYKAKQFDENNAVINSHIASITKHLEKLKKEEEIRRARELEIKQAINEKQAKINALLIAALDNEKKFAFDAAIIIYEQLLEIEPNNVEYKQKIEQVRQMQKEYLENKKMIDEKIKHAEDSFAAKNYNAVYETISTLLTNQFTPLSKVLPMYVEASIYINKFDEAKKWLEKLANITNIEKNEIKFLDGLLLYCQGEYDKARETLYEVYKLNPNLRPEFRKIVWHLWYEKYKYGIFVSVFFIVLYFGSFFTNLYKSARSKFEQRKFESILASGNSTAIIDAIESKLKQDVPNQTRKQYLIILAENYLKVGRYQDALRSVNEILQKDMKHPMALRVQAEALYQLKETTSDALDKIYNLYKLDESRKDLLSFLASAYKQNKAEHNSALEILHKQVALSPDDVDTIIYLANLYFKRQNFNSQNVKIYERATKLDPEKPEYTYGLIECLKQSNKTEEAEKVFAKAIEKWPSHPLFRTQDEVSSRFASTKASSKIMPTDIDVTKFYKDYVENNNQNVSKEAKQKSSQLPNKENNTNINTNINNLEKADNDKVKKYEQSAQASNRVLASVSDNFIICANCSSKNSLRDYYCVKCGKPIR